MVDAAPTQLEHTRMNTQRELANIAGSKDVIGLSHLSLPEVEQMADEVSSVLPAGNVPAMILSGLARLSGRQSPASARRDINILFKGVELALDKAVYSTFFAGPAAVIWGYQHLLKLAGKNPEDAFPEGVWQFYVDYALREDTARHANETHGFDSLLSHHGMNLPYVDRLTAWVMAAIKCLHQYPMFLENEWRERVYIRLLNEVTADTPYATQFQTLYRRWEAIRPYRRTQEAQDSHSYAEFRRAEFDKYFQEATRSLPLTLKTELAERIDQAQQEDLLAYQRQMSILAYLNTGAYGEERIAMDLAEARIGVIYRGRYYLIPVCKPGSTQPAEVTTVRAQLMAMLKHEPQTPAAQLNILAGLRRAALHQIRGTLNPTLQAGLNELRYAPIVLNFDTRAVELPLAELRQTERGCGDHALTVFDTGRSFVFDQSHIFFDGEWGAAFAEIMTNQALSMAVRLRKLSAPPGTTENPPHEVVLPLNMDEVFRLQHLPQVTREACAENSRIHIHPVRALRQVLKQRNDFLAMLTVNDLLLLYRAIHAATYVLNPHLMKELKALLDKETLSQAALMVLDALQNDRAVNPTVMIPVNAGMRSPRERVCPLSFEVPLHHLDFVALHQQVLEALTHYQEAKAPRQEAYRAFKSSQKTYLTALAALAEVLHRVKKMALHGESGSASTIKLLAHLPPALQRLLDKVPQQFDVLYDLIKGREVFSNVGAVVPTSTLRRFITAKDDNDKKTLCWGVITDAQGTMYLSLRDFRPHVAALMAAGRKDLADKIAQDYLDRYAEGFNQFVRDLYAITLGRPLESAVPEALPEMMPVAAQAWLELPAPPARTTATLAELHASHKRKTRVHTKITTE